MRWRSGLKHWATRQKVAGSIPDVVFGIFYLTWSFRSTQPTTLQLSWVDCIEIWKPQLSVTFCACHWDCFTVNSLHYALPDYEWSPCSNTVSNWSVPFTCSLKKGIVSCFVEYPNISMGGYIKAKNSFSNKQLSANRWSEPEPAEAGIILLWLIPSQIL